MKPLPTERRPDLTQLRARVGLWDNLTLAFRGERTPPGRGHDLGLLRLNRGFDIAIATAWDLSRGYGWPCMPKTALSRGPMVAADGTAKPTLTN